MVSDRRINDMTEAPQHDARIALDVDAFIQAARLANASAKAYVALSVFGLSGKSNPAYDDVFTHGQNLDNFLTALFPMDYNDHSDGSNPSDAVDDFLMATLADALGLDADEFIASVREEAASLR